MKVNNTVYGEPLPCEIYVDKLLFNTLGSLDKYRKHDFDAVGLFTGEEGSGKTRFAMQQALLLDHNFSNKNIVFNANQFEEAIDRLPFGSVIMWDEADDVGAGWASQMMFTLKKTFKRIRKRNYIIFLVTPTFHDLNKYFAIHRTRFLINIYTKQITRGFWNLYKRDKKKLLYIKGKKEMNMRCVMPDMRGRFTDLPPLFPVDLEEYEKAKDEATIQAIEDERYSKKDLKVEIYGKLKERLEGDGFSWLRKDYADVLGVSPRTISRYTEQLELTK